MTNREQRFVYEKRVLELKRLLHSTDYKAIKYAEGEITAEEYAETKELRKGWREEINALEAEIIEPKEAQKSENTNL